MLAIGLMSGTSLDGVDLALVEIQEKDKETSFQLKNFRTYPLSEELVKKIKKACDKNESRVDMICSLNFEFGHVFSHMIQQFCEDVHVSIEDIDFIANHGQTIYHISRNQSTYYPSSLQIGESAIIAYDHQTMVISQFRVMDIAAGGEGAPLVPYSEYVLYRDEKKSRALINIGGISNITVLPENCCKDDVFAFDMGPGNMMINEACHQLYSCSFDKDGYLASRGEINESLFQVLKQHSFIKREPPKSTGREEFGKFFVEDLLKQFEDVKPCDIIATLTYFTAYCISENIKNFVLPKVKMLDEVILSGGGAHNKTLVSMIKDLLGDIVVCTQEEIGMSSDAKEAVAFVVIGYETLHQRAGNMKTTGAKDYVILGNITYPPIVKEKEHGAY